ncbi:phage tail length tape measure family protein [Azospirillum himalayense]|uniref:Phage tail length tape measure family protein n=1 Tax=Azospirillum himalayense TaxID=654847 RepID=A0ABW0FY73_9PROT
MATDTREIVTILTIDARQAEHGARQFAAALENTAKSSDDLAQAVARGERTLDASAKVTRRNAQELENLLRAFDPLYGANQRLAESQQKLARAAETVDAQFRKGLITDQQRVERMTLLTGRSAELTKITDDLSKGLINHETAQIRSAKVMATHTQAAGQLTNALGLTRAQMQALSPQINDVVSGLIMGQQPMQIFTQQSGQIVQALQAGGAEMPKVRMSAVAMAGAFGIAAAGAAVLVSRLISISSEGRRLDGIMRTLNPGLSATADQLRQIAFQVADEQGVSRADVMAALEVAIKNTRIQSTALLKDISELSVNISSVMGGEASEWAAKLSEAAKTGAAGFSELASQLPGIKADTLAAARAAEQQGDRMKALGLIMGDLQQRWNGASRSMKNDFSEAMRDMWNSWDQFVERWTKDPRVATGAKIVAQMIKWVTPDTQNEARAKEMASVLEALDLKTAQLQSAVEKGQSGPGVEMLRRQVAELQGQYYALAQAAEEANKATKGVGGNGAAGGTATPSGAQPPGMSEAEKDRINRAQEATDRWAEAMRKTGAARQVAVSGVEAYNAAIERGATKEVARAERLEAERRAQIGLSASIADANIQLSASAQYTLASASAYLQAGEAAGAYAEALRQAKQEELSTGVNADTRAKQLMAEKAAQTALAGAQQVPALEREAEARQKVAAAAMQGVQAQQAAELAYKIEQATLQERLALVNANAETETVLLDVIARKTQAITEEDAAARKLAAAGMLQQQRDQLVVGQKQLDLMWASAEVRALEMARTQALIDLRNRNIDATSAEGAAYLANAEALARQGLEIDRSAQAYQELERFGDQALSSVVDATVKGEDATKSWRNTIKGLGAEFQTLALRMMAINPIKNAVFGTNLATFGSFFGGGAANQNAQSGGMGGAGNLLSGASGLNTLSGGGLMDKLFPGGGFSLTSSIDSFGMGMGFGPGTNFVGPMLPGTQGIFGGASLSQFLGGAGLGFGAGSLLNSLVGGNAVGGTVGSGVGGLAGAAIGSIVPGVGTLLGGLIGGAGGGLLGGLFGNNKPSNMEGNVSLDFASGKATVGGQTGSKYSQENRDAASALGGQVQQLAATLEALLPGIQIAGKGLVAVGSRDGLRAEYGGEKAEFGKEDAAGLVQWFTKQFAEDMRDGFEKGGLTEQVAGNLQLVLDKGITGSVEQFIADLQLAATDFAKVFDMLGKAQPDQTATTVQAAAQSFIATRDAAEKLGLSVTGLADSFRAGADRILDAGIRAAQGFDGVDRAMSINATFAANATAMLAAGQSPDKAIKLYGAQMSALVNSLDVKHLEAMAEALKGIDDVAVAFATERKRQLEQAALDTYEVDAAARIRAANLALGQITQDQYDRMEAETKWASELKDASTDAMRARILEVQAIEKQALASQQAAKAAQANAEAQKAFASASTSTRSYLLSLLTGEAGGLSAQDRYANARSEYASASAAIGSQATAEQLARQTEAAKALVDASRAVNGSTTAYFLDLADITGDLAKSAQLTPDDPVVKAINDLKASVDGLGGGIRVTISGALRAELEDQLRRIVSVGFDQTSLDNLPKLQQDIIKGTLPPLRQIATISADPAYWSSLSDLQKRIISGTLDPVTQAVSVAYDTAKWEALTPLQKQILTDTLPGAVQGVSVAYDTAKWSALTDLQKQIITNTLPGATQAISVVYDTAKWASLTDLQRQIITGTLPGASQALSIVYDAEKWNALTDLQKRLITNNLEATNIAIALSYDQAAWGALSSRQKEIIAGTVEPLDILTKLSTMDVSNISVEQQKLLFGAADEYTRVLKLGLENKGTFTKDQMDIINAQTGTIDRTINSILGGATSLSQDQRNILTATSGTVDRYLNNWITNDVTETVTSTAMRDLTTGFQVVQLQTTSMIIRQLDELARQAFVNTAAIVQAITGTQWGAEAVAALAAAPRPTVLTTGDALYLTRYGDVADWWSSNPANSPLSHYTQWGAGQGRTWERGYADGGVVGNGLPGVDSVAARYRDGSLIGLAGGEYVTPTAGVTGETKPMLDYIRQHRALPSMRPMVMPAANSNRGPSNGEVVAAVNRLIAVVEASNRENTTMIQKQALMEDAGLKAQTAALTTAITRTKSKQAASAA